MGYSSTSLQTFQVTWGVWAVLPFIPSPSAGLSMESGLRLKGNHETIKANPHVSLAAITSLHQVQSPALNRSVFRKAFRDWYQKASESITSIVAFTSKPFHTRLQSPSTLVSLPADISYFLPVEVLVPQAISQSLLLLKLPTKALQVFCSKAPFFSSFWCSFLYLCNVSMSHVSQGHQTWLWCSRLAPPGATLRCKAAPLPNSVIASLSVWNCSDES